MRADFPPHGGDLAWAALRYGLPPRDFLDFSANVNPLGPSAQALEAAANALSLISGYPEPDAGSLKRELAAWLGIAPDVLMLGNGSTELIHHLVRCVEPRRVVITSPSFGEYERAARISGGQPAYYQLYPQDDFALDPGELAGLAEVSDMVFFCNPASPTGRLYSRAQLLPALAACRENGRLLVVDESFMGFCEEAEARECTLLCEAGGDGLVVVSTLTKLFALAGLRGPGWLAGPRELVARLEEMAVPWRVNAVAVAAAGASLADARHLSDTREKVAAWRRELNGGLEGTGIFQTFPSSACFLLLRVLHPSLQVARLADELGRRGMLIRNCHNFRGLEEGFVRVAVREPRDNRRLIAAVTEVRDAL